MFDHRPAFGREYTGPGQPRLNALLKGKIGLFSLDALVTVASKAGLSVRLVVKKAA